MERILFDELGFGAFDVKRGLSCSVSSLPGSQLHVSWVLHSDSLFNSCFPHSDVRNTLSRQLQVIRHIIPLSGVRSEACERWYCG